MFRYLTMMYWAITFFHSRFLNGFLNSIDNPFRSPDYLPQNRPLHPRPDYPPSALPRAWGARHAGGAVESGVRRGRFTFATRVSVRLTLMSGWSARRRKSFGDMMAGVRKRRKRKPLTLTYLWSSTHTHNPATPPHQ